MSNAKQSSSVSCALRTADRSQSAPSSPELDLFVASALALFLEVALIRWVPAYERVLAYFANFVLIAAFLGLGLGATLARRSRNLIRYQPMLLLGLVVVSILFQRYVKTYGAAGDVFYTDWWRQSKVSLLLVECLAFFFVLITVVFLPLGQKIGEDLAAVSPPLKAYTLNVLGSLV